MTGPVTKRRTPAAVLRGSWRTQYGDLTPHRNRRSSARLGAPRAFFARLTAPVTNRKTRATSPRGSRCSQTAVSEGTSSQSRNQPWRAAHPASAPFLSTRPRGSAAVTKCQSLAAVLRGSRGSNATIPPPRKGPAVTSETLARCSLGALFFAAAGIGACHRT